MSEPPDSPAVGTCYIVGAGAGGAWAGKDHAIAAASTGGWRFIPPFEGLTAFVRSNATFAVFRSGAWELGLLRGSSLHIDGQQVVGPRQPPIPSPVGGTNADAEARLAITGILTALRQHGLIAL